MIKEIKIYDMDGTIVCSMHRYRAINNERIDLEHWRKHDIEEYIMQDSLLPLAEQYKQDLNNPNVYVIIATARACIKGDANYKFIEQNLGLPNKFVHRQGVDDNRGGAQLKIQAIKPLLNLKQFKNAIVHVFEDNKKYLSDMCNALNGIPHYVESRQGH